MKLSNFSFILIIIIFVFLFTNCSKSKNKIYGSVKFYSLDLNKVTKAFNANVYLLTSDGKLVEKTSVDEGTGDFEFKNIPEGEFYLESYGTMKFFNERFYADYYGKSKNFVLLKDDNKQITFFIHPASSGIYGTVCIPNPILPGCLNTDFELHLYTHLDDSVVEIKFIQVNYPNSYYYFSNLDTGLYDLEARSNFDGQLYYKKKTNIEISADTLIFIGLTLHKVKQ